MFTEDDFFDAIEYLEEHSIGYEEYMGQYFNGDYCPFLHQIDKMYGATDLSSIEVPLSVRDMFKAEV